MIERISIAGVAHLLIVLLACNAPSGYPERLSITSHEILVECNRGSTPRLHATDRGDIYLSWTEYLTDSLDALQFARWTGDHWSSPNTIAQGSNWFTNWADFPSMASFSGMGQHLAAHYLQYRDTGTYDYDIRIKLSQDGGESWSESFLPHRDGVAAEHGFVSMVALTDQQMLITWLDGRNTTENDHHSHNHGHTGAMTLRSAAFDPQGNLYEEVLLDDRVCDCCQTGATLTPDGPLIVYRNRSEDEIRDIYYVKYLDKSWSEPRPVHHDGWQIGGCPVNGPAIISYGDYVATTWFTAARDSARLWMAWSDDRGETFQAPTRIDDGQPLGRVDMVWVESRQAVLISWLEDQEEMAAIKARMIWPDGQRSNSITLQTTSSSRSSGFPRLISEGQRMLLAWTDVSGDHPRVRTHALHFAE